MLVSVESGVFDSIGVKQTMRVVPREWKDQTLVPNRGESFFFARGFEHDGTFISYRRVFARI